jgi:hypothetical protein
MLCNLAAKNRNKIPQKQEIKYSKNRNKIPQKAEKIVNLFNYVYICNLKYNLYGLSTKNNR